MKSIFVPESYLREEIRVGYDQAGGDDATAKVEKKPLVEFKPVAAEAEEPAPEESDTEEPEVDEVEVLDTFAADEDSEDDAIGADAVGDEAVEKAPESDPVAPETRLFDSINEIGNDFEHEPATTGGGVFGNDFTTVLQTLMMSGNNMPVADILEEGVYELNGIKSYLDSIAQSLSKIADKYVGDSGNNKRDRGNKPWNNDRGNNKPWNNDKNRGRDDGNDDIANLEDGLDE